MLSGGHSTPSKLPPSAYLTVVVLSEGKPPFLLWSYGRAEGRTSLTLNFISSSEYIWGGWGVGVGFALTGLCFGGVTILEGLYWGGESGGGMGVTVLRSLYWGGGFELGRGVCNRI